MSYWSKASISSQTFDVVSQEELEEALAWVDHAAMRTDRIEKRASYLKNIIRDMVSTLSAHFRDAFTDFEDMLARIPTPAPPAPALALAHALSPGDDDDVDLGDF